MIYSISHPDKIINSTIELPSSKSISNRVLIIRALCKEKFQIHNLSKSDDTKSLLNALQNLNNEINVEHAGTNLRFLTAYLSIQKGKEFVLTGSKRIQERPIKELVESLQTLGADISYLNKKHKAPLKIYGKDLIGDKIKIKGNISSQFISALLLIAPTLKNGLKINIAGEIVSESYINMTLMLMSKFGINYEKTKNTINIKHQNYVSKEFYIESDWSAASFWYEIAALSKQCNINLVGLDKYSIQGDKEIINIYKNLSVRSKFENNVLNLTKDNKINIQEKINIIQYPDLYQPLKCTLFALNSNTKIIGLNTLKQKETNRIAAVKKEFKNICNFNTIDTYNDHRMAMSFAPLCLKYNYLKMKNIHVVSKSYPNYWKDLKKCGFKIDQITD